MDEITINLDDSPIISQPASLLIGEQNPVVVQENFVGGQNATIQIGSVETLPAGSQAYVNNVGTETHAILNFGLVTGNTGESGENGSDGSDGAAATIQIGTVTTGLPNTNASVTNVGTPNAAILDFTIPQGVQGLQGIQGVAGVDGISPRAYVEQITGGARVVVEDSETTTTADIMDGADGTDGVDGFSPIATVTPTAAGATISITDAQGTTTANITNGVDGTDGTDGTSATVTVGSTTTGNAGTNASVTNSGTSSAAVFDFVIPRGADGTNGTNGVDGFSPVATVTQNTGSATISITDSQGTTTATVYDGTTPSVQTLNPSDVISLNSGFSFYSSGGYSHSWVRKYGNLIVASFVIESSTNYTTSNTVIGSVNSTYKPAIVWNGDCAFGSANAVKDTGYFYFNGESPTGGNITVATASTSSYKFLKVKLVYLL